MNVLVTGGAGFIGSNFLRYMLAKYPDYRFVNIDKLTYAGNMRNIAELESNKSYRFVKGDIANQAQVNALFEQEQFDAVIHFAAESHVDRSIVDPSIFVDTNVLGTQYLLEAARTYDLQKFVHISTDEVYGSLGAEGLFTETTPLAPNSPYSASKAASDMFVRAYYQTYGLPAVITRCSNNYGPFQHEEKLIPLMLTRALRDESLPVYGDGLNVRDWLYVDDHCQAIDLVLHQGVNGEIYNIGGNNEHTNLFVVKTILRALNKPESLIKYVEDRLGHDRRYGIDARKIRQELGWEPVVTFEVGIERTINWYVQQMANDLS